jgi:hypothetical protein
MTEPEDFLTRWSRRKRETAERAPEATPQAEPRTGEPRHGEGVTQPPAAQAETGVPAADLTKLPSLDSITGDSDVRAFLRSGVPEQLKSAALRRVWAADPAIRNFVGLAENAWDFNAPESVPGFGPMLPTADVAGMVARLSDNVVKPTQRAIQTQGDAVADDSARETAKIDDMKPAAPTPGNFSEPPHAVVVSAHREQNPRDHAQWVDISEQNQRLPEPPPGGKSHGGAVPK